MLEKVYLIGIIFVFLKKMFNIEKIIYIFIVYLNVRIGILFVYIRWVVMIFIIVGFNIFYLVI